MKSQLGVTTILRLAAVTALAFVLNGAFTPAVTTSETSSFVVSHLGNAIKRFKVTGTVESVDYASNSVGINASGQHVEILVTPTTVIEYRGEAGSIADVRRGHKITASGLQRDGMWIANSVIIR
jgi:hypothetical protein